ncbi:TAM-1 protein [Aphelenchoides avenae]|nr:TAM-1 protein [Aphelenchus avenae]
MDLMDGNLAKTLECPVCLDIFDEPKLLNCGHTVCQKCVNKAAKTRLIRADAWPAQDQKCLKCPECGTETKIPPHGLTTNYRLVDLVSRVKTSLVDVYACNDCRKQEPIADMFTCETCQETLSKRPIWICAVCAMKQHKSHITTECNKATQQEVRDACKDISSSGSLADMYIGLTMSHLNGALKKTELISKRLNKRRPSLQTATDLKEKFEKASTIANRVGKDLESVLQSFYKELEELLPSETMDESETNE